MPRPTQHPIADIRHLKGAGKKIAFAFDLKSTPGKVIVHTIQFDTHHIDAADFEAMTFPVLHDDNDERIKHLADCIRST